MIDLILDLFIWKPKLKDILKWISFIIPLGFISLGIPDQLSFELGFIGAILAIGLNSLVELLTQEAFEKFENTKNIFKATRYAIVIGLAIYLFHHFDIDFFEENLAEFVKEFKNMLETGYGIFKIISK